MPRYSVTFARSARRELEKCERLTVRRLLAVIESLAHEPRPPKSLKLQGRANLWRVRVGDLRILYSIDDEQLAVDIIAIGHRREVYR